MFAGNVASAAIARVLTRPACRRPSCTPRLSRLISTLRQTFTPENFIAHLEKQAGNVEAKAQRAAERAHLLEELPKLAAAEQRLVKRIATIDDDALVAALKTEWADAKSTRETAERRLAELEGIERDLRAEQADVQALVDTWKSWSETLAHVQKAAAGSVPAETQAQARQILKKVLVGSIAVTPLPALAAQAKAAREEYGDERGWVFVGSAGSRRSSAAGSTMAVTSRCRTTRPRPRCWPTLTRVGLSLVSATGPSRAATAPRTAVFLPYDPPIGPPCPPHIVTPRRSRGAPRYRIRRPPPWRR
jgi:hypothetical protein